jgi:hypothetical protein
MDIKTIWAKYLEIDNLAKIYWNFLKESQCCGPIQYTINGKQ